MSIVERTCMNSSRPVSAVGISSFQPSVSILWYSFSFPASTNTHKSSYTHIRWLHTQHMTANLWCFTEAPLGMCYCVCRKYKGPHLHLLHLRVFVGQSHIFITTGAGKDHAKLLINMMNYKFTLSSLVPHKKHSTVPSWESCGHWFPDDCSRDQPADISIPCTYCELYCRNQADQQTW